MHEDDLRWLANFALGTAFFVAFMGVTLAQFMAQEARCYVMVMAVLLGAMFATIGVGFHWMAWKRIRDTTISRLEGEQYDRLQNLRERSREGGSNGEDC
jgi:hypothetical protein